MSSPYCRHDIPADQCALCAPRRAGPVGLVLNVPPAGQRNSNGLTELLHRADCQFVTQPAANAAEPWERREVTQADAQEHPEWQRCKTCAP